MEKQYYNIFKHYNRNIIDYADNCLKHDLISIEEHADIINCCEHLKRYLNENEPKEPKKDE